VRWVVRDTTFNRGGGKKAKFAAMKIHRQCPFVLLVKVSWIGGKKRSEVKKVVMKCGARKKLSRGPLHSI
jgi:hypothetical protein